MEGSTVAWLDPARVHAPRRFEDRGLLVTGGGSGLGAAVARRFDAEGGRVAVLDFDPARAEAVAAGLGRGVALTADVSDERAVVDAVRAATEQLGRLDCVVNAAGHVVLARFEKLSLEDWNRMLAVHVTGTFLVSRASLPALRAAGGGSIVNISSTGGLVGRPFLSAYAAAKGAVIALSRQMAVELAPEVRVNVVAPGDARTSLTTPLYEQLGGGDLEAGEAQVASNNLLERVAEPEEIAAAICFLLSADASYFTGSLVVADGGVTAL